MKAHVAKEIEAEEHVALALSHYGPVVFGGKVWQTAVPPRPSRVIAFRFQVAKDLPWPPEEKAAEPLVVEKVAGFISQQHC